ncbi:MAG: hypothetical protein MUC59_09240 [Saprospiraceae bacterium]|jgi:hypothetical protein|nr:hypothetical protein [Saprospiraceae bacterium]
MLIIGNLFLGIAAVIFMLMFNLTFLRTPPGGDAGVGYAWTLIFGVLGFSICMAIVTAIIGGQGGFGWVQVGTVPRWVIVLLGFLVIIIGNGFFMFNEFPVKVPAPLRVVLMAIPALLPLLIMVSAGILLNANYAELSPKAYKLPIYISLVLSAVGFMIIMLHRLQVNAAVLKSNVEFQDRTHQNHLNHIDTTDVMKDGVFLYVLTDANHDQDVREAALAKLKTRPDWQEELTRRLQNDWAPEAFNFLASNDVDNKAIFPEPVRQGVLIQARLIRESIRQCRDKYDLYEGRFTWEVDRVIRTVDKFEGMGTDFRPAMQELRNALDERTSFEKPKLPAKDMLEKWLKKNIAQ